MWEKIDNSRNLKVIFIEYLFICREIECYGLFFFVDYGIIEKV